SGGLDQVERKGVVVVDHEHSHARRAATVAGEQGGVATGARRRRPLRNGRGEGSARASAPKSAPKQAHREPWRDARAAPTSAAPISALMFGARARARLPFGSRST